MLDPRAGAFFDLSPRAKIQINGNDRLRFLNGQMTNDVRKATNGNAIAACILSAKGKLDAHVFVSVVADGFVIDADPELREGLSGRLERYVIADDVDLADITERWSLFHVIGKDLPELPPESRTVSVSRFGRVGRDVWCERDKREEISERLKKVIPFFDEIASEVFRIEQGIPRWGRELTPEIIPVEANLEETCIDYEKGCYIGQEIISRMKMSGQRNKKLCGLIAVNDAAAIAGAKLFSDDGKDVGWITSAAQSERLHKNVALGYVKRGFNSSGTVLRSSSGQLQVVDLPLT